MPYKADDMTARFPNKTITRMDGEPNYDSINALCMQLYGNAGAIPTGLGGGGHGHIGLVMDPALYTTLSATGYVSPTAPNRTPPGNLTAVEREEAEKIYLKAKGEYDDHNTMQELLKAQIQEAVDDVYTRQLKNKYTGYLGVTIRDLIDHLLDRYGKITAADIASNNKQFLEGMDMDQPIDVYFTKIDDSVQYAADGKTPYTAQQIVTAAENAVRKTGMYKEPLRRWREKPTADKTWTNFKTFFADEYHLLREDEDNTQQGSGYHQANAMTGVTTALEHLAMAATADKRTMEELATTNRELSEANKLFAVQLGTLTESIKQLTQKVELLNKRKPTRPPRQQGNIDWDPIGYCWSCGWKVDKRHNSFTCNSPKPGHQKAATRSNPMGGSDKNKEWNG